MSTTESEPTRVLPSGVGEGDFERAVAAFEHAVGAENVVTEPRELAAYHDPYPVTDTVEHAPSAVVRPGSTEETQAIVRIANEYRIPLSPVSTGKNNGYGGAAPRLAGAVVVHMNRMNRILVVNE